MNVNTDVSLLMVEMAASESGRIWKRVTYVEKKGQGDLVCPPVALKWVPEEDASFLQFLLH